MKQLLTLIIPLSIVLASEVACSQQMEKQNPMDRFKGLTGTFHTAHTLYSQEGKVVETFEGTAEIYFVDNGSVFVVDEFTDDNKYRFIGYHSYNEETGKYSNWTASSSHVLAWSAGEWDDSTEIFTTWRIDPRTGEKDTLSAKGVWTIIDNDTHIFKAIRFLPDGAEIPFKEERYTRIEQN